MDPTEIDSKGANQVRLVTFNVNGLRTLFQYHPFSRMNGSLAQAFDYFQADVITFQELKTDKLAVTKWGKVDDFYSFISIPVNKKGYSGVGCWIRIPKNDDPLSQKLCVLKAEEGITGILSIKNGKVETSYRDDPEQGIGGYNSLGLEDDKEALELDSEGRCVMVELSSNLIIISVYCPANSSQTEEGERFRLKFLNVLFRRIRNFHKMGKEVVLMGDINVSRDLIDHAESLEQLGIKIKDLNGGKAIEKNHFELAEEFIYNPGRIPRRIFNQMLADSIIPSLSQHGILVDTTRYIQGRNRLKMYTVWNTMKNSRPANYGSRIDFILVSIGLKASITNANIWTNVMGSDHCPVFADITIPCILPQGTVKAPIPKFEARYRYQLNQGSILDMFSKSRTGASIVRGSMTNGKSQMKVLKKPAKPKSKIDSFFKVVETTKRKKTSEIKKSLHEKELDTTLNIQASSNSRTVTLNTLDSLAEVFGKPPLCKHGEEAILKTSKTSSNPGKKFWTCKRPRGDSNDTHSSCGFFQWN